MFEKKLSRKNFLYEEESYNKLKFKIFYLKFELSWRPHVGMVIFIN